MSEPHRQADSCVRRWTVVLLMAALAAVAGATAAAQSTTPPAAAQAQALYREVMSPFCPGLTLADCPSPQAFERRGDIERRLKNGESRQAIVDELVAAYGPQILSDPSDTPIGRIVWGVPIVLSVLAAGGLAWFLRRITRFPGAASEGGSESADERDRLDEELAALD